MHFLYARLVELDSFVHNWIMNPMFIWIQKWTHWNRFDLAIAAAWGSFLGFVMLEISWAVIVVIEGYDWLLPVHFVICSPIGLFFFALAYFSDDLRQASKNYEELNGVRFKNPLNLTDRMMKTRLLLNLLFLLFCLQAIYVYQYSTHFTDVLLPVSSSFFILMVLVQTHLRSGTDVDPKDRVYFGARKLKPASDST